MLGAKTDKFDTRQHKLFSLSQPEFVQNLINIRLTDPSLATHLANHNTLNTTKKSKNGKFSSVLC